MNQLFYFSAPNKLEPPLENDDKIADDDYLPADVFKKRGKGRAKQGILTLNSKQSPTFPNSHARRNSKKSHGKSSKQDSHLL